MENAVHELMNVSCVYICVCIIESRDRRLPYGDDRRSDGRIPNTSELLLIISKIKLVSK